MTLSSPDVPELRCWAEIDLEALRENARVCNLLAGGNCRLMAIVKADAYGHGLERVVTALTNEVDWFGVANVTEAQRTRNASGSEIPILILSPPTPSEIEPIVAGRFSASVSSLEEISAFADAAARLGIDAKLHAVADTGMGRMGAQGSAFLQLARIIKATPGCLLEGLETHFPSADEEPDFTAEQIRSFQKLIEKIDGAANCEIHLGNSAGLLGFNDATLFATLTRPGLALYGISPLAGAEDKLQPALSLKSRITLIRDIPAGTSISYGRTFVADEPMKVATLGLGYGDGYPRHLSGAGMEVLIQGKRCPLLGRVTMDQIVVDVSHLDKTPACGEEAILIGKQGDETISAEEMAAKAGTIPWEILTGITSRVERVYRGS
ncbi:MAG: alanine racemase [Verrucomicrobiales bacterium]|nr:alanine racemase [Verrucomicrobiales bacterium]